MTYTTFTTSVTGQRRAWNFNANRVRDRFRENQLDGDGKLSEKSNAYGEIVRGGGEVMTLLLHQWLVSSESPDREPVFGRYARTRMNIEVCTILGRILAFCIGE